MTEITTTVGGLIVSAVVVILTAILVKLFSRSGLLDNTNNGDGSGAGVDAGAGGLPLVPIPNTSSSSSSSGCCWKYDVFLSFRGEDTRKTFVDHIYSALQQHRILTYKDDVTLDRGDTIGPSLLKAIEESQILVIIFSENYADSSWCLDELSHIMKCRDSETGQIVFPIFYHVEPSDVRKQKGQFGKAFAKHKKKTTNKVESWKKALVDATNIAGWEPKHVANGHEAKCIEEIVDSILVKLSSLNSVINDGNLVGMGNRLKDLKSQLKIGSGGVRMVGIWGLGGGGKTTLATSLYLELKISGQFPGCCFVGNIREESKQQNGLKILQEKILSTIFDKELKVESVDIGKRTIKDMLCRRKVLIVLDDVDHLDQLEALAGRHDWFGDGSRIIITTRDEHLLTTHRVDVVSPISLLSHDESIRLFNKHGYCDHKPVQDYEMLSRKIVSYADGLPLALIVLGSFLYDKDYDEWIDTLSRLKDHPEMGIVEKLRISYDGLKPVEKELFLDIACFFRWKSKDDAMEMLDACGFHPHIGVKVLIQKALISVSKDGMFDMHDLIQEMAHYIVRGEHPNNPEKHSRLWRIEDIEDICLRNAAMENDRVKAIKCYYNDWSCNFIMLVSNMKKLRFLKVRTRFESVYEEGPSFLSNELMYIDLKGYPASLFPESFQPTKLVVLKMKRSLQEELWKGYKYLPRLKELRLSHIKALVRTPDFGGLPCLQKLILFECGSLEEIHQSLGNHSSLVSVKVRSCDKLTRFPSIARMEKLEILRISKCKALVEFPKIEAKMDNLVELCLDRVGIKVVPSSVVEYCTNLISLELKDCSNLESIEGNLDALKCLENFHSNIYKLVSGIGKGFLSQLPRMLRKLNLGWCKLKDGDIPSHIGELSNLQELNLSGNKFTRLDFSLSRLTRLQLLDLRRCRNLVELPELPSSLAILKANLCESLEAVIRDEIHRNCKWLSQVSISGGMMNKKNKIGGGERLLETMLQGNAVESGCMILEVEGLEIARGFEPRLVRGWRCRMQLPENWYNDFSGFLFCAAAEFGRLFEGTMMIKMKHEENGGWMGMGDDESTPHDDYSVYDDDWKQWYTRVWYIPFSLLRHTSWWDPTSTVIHMELDLYEEGDPGGCGLKLVPKRVATESSSSGQKETTPTHSSSEISLDDDDYKCKLYIIYDSKSAFKCRFW